MSQSSIFKRSVATLDLAPELRERLISAGYSEISQLQNKSPLDLAKELNISKNVALRIIRQVPQKKMQLTTVSAAELLLNESHIPYVSFPNRELNQIFGGKGIPCGKLTEVCGEPGIGKTQFCMQAAVNVQLSTFSSFVNAKVIYIDTEGSLHIDRLAEIASITLKQFSPQDSVKDLEQILENILIYRVQNYLELVALIYSLPSTISQELPNVKLIIIDSIAFPFRQRFSDMALRTRLLYGLGSQLTTIATTYQLAVIVTNQMTTKFQSAEDQERAVLVPALGESWANLCNTRVILQYLQGSRAAKLEKSSFLPPGTAIFTINEGGIR